MFFRELYLQYLIQAEKVNPQKKVGESKKGRWILNCLRKSFPAIPIKSLNYRWRADR